MRWSDQGMKFALLGIDADSLRLAETVQSDADHELIAVYDAHSKSGNTPLDAVRLPPSQSWESILGSLSCDAVIVSQMPGQDPDLRADQLRKLVQLDVPLLVVQPACEAIIGYELEMIRADNRCVVYPFVPGAQHPAIKKMRAILQEQSGDENPPAEQLVFERPLASRKRDEVLRRFMRDVHLMRKVMGKVQQIAAMGAGEDDLVYTSLNVQLRFQNGVLAHWALKPELENLEARLTAIGSSKTVELSMGTNEANWSLRLDQGNAGESFTFPAFDSYQDGLCEFVSAVERNTFEVGWNASCRDIEISETIRDALRRRRTIDLYEEEHSEEATFKGLMALGGCGLLSFGVILLLIAGVVEGLKLPLRNNALWQRWPLFLLVLVLVFLLLQLLQLVFQRESVSDSSQVVLRK